MGYQIIINKNTEQQSLHQQEHFLETVILSRILGKNGLMPLGINIQVIYR